jgi:hypothetical protein
MFPEWNRKTSTLKSVVTSSPPEATERRRRGKAYVERRQSAFCRTLTPPSDGDEAEVHVNGALTLMLPKREDAAPNKATIKG